MNANALGNSPTGTTTLGRASASGRAPEAERPELTSLLEDVPSALASGHVAVLEDEGGDVPSPTGRFLRVGLSPIEAARYEMAAWT